jgi:hypothetical protein
MKTRNPERHPKLGDRFAKVVTNRNGVTMVQCRTVLKGTDFGIFYTPKRRTCYTSNGLWKVWLKDAHCAGGKLEQNASRKR